MTRTVLCFGDSNTYGLSEDGNFRYPKHVRWTGILKEHLGKNYDVIEEGLNGRTTVLTHPTAGKIKNGLKYLPACLASHAPLDLVIFMLGSNDAKDCYNLCAEDISLGMETLLNVVKFSTCGLKEAAPHILLLTPPPIGPNVEKGERYKGMKSRLKGLDDFYYQLSQKFGCSFLETRKFVQKPGSDGLHLDKVGHKKLGTAVAAMVTCIFKE